MNQLDSAAISAFLREQYALWNQGKRAELMALFRKLAPQGMTVEFVGDLPVCGGNAADPLFLSDRRVSALGFNRSADICRASAVGRSPR
jgi:hypothetical protein